MELLCEFQDVYSEHKNDFGVGDLLCHITPKPDAELKKQRNTRNPRDEKIGVDEWKKMELLNALVLMLHAILN